MEENGKKNLIKYAAVGAAVIACAVIFIVFGKRPAIPSGEETATPLPEATEVPGGVTVERFVSALRSSGMDCVITGPDRADGALVYALEMPNENDSGSVTLKTDKLGRVESCVLELGYINIPDNSFEGAVGEKLKAEYDRRVSVDKALITEFLSAVFGECGDECGIGAVDRSTIIKAVCDCCTSGKDLSKKYGSARFLCGTVIDGEDGRFTFEIRFDPDKMK